MFYATWSKGSVRVASIGGGISRLMLQIIYDHELGWKTTFGPVRWNGAIYHEVWKKLQFAFLGANSFTEIHNGKDARINGIETDMNYMRGGLTLNAAAAYTDAKTKGNICNFRPGYGSELRRSVRRHGSGTAGLHHGPKRHTPAGHAEIQGERHRPLHVARVD